MVFVQSHDGNTGAADPSTLGGGETDKHLIYEGLSRVTADAVLAGAETVRSTDIFFSVWREEFVALRAALGKPRHPAQIIATLGGMDLENELVFNIPELTVFVLTAGAGLARMREALAFRPWLMPIVMPHQTDLAAAFRGLRREGIARISIVGGRTIAAASDRRRARAGSLRHDVAGERRRAEHADVSTAARHRAGRRANAARARTPASCSSIAALSRLGSGFSRTVIEP